MVDLIDAVKSISLARPEPTALRVPEVGIKHRPQTPWGTPSKDCGFLLDGALCCKVGLGTVSWAKDGLFA